MISAKTLETEAKVFEALEAVEVWYDGPGLYGIDGDDTFEVDGIDAAFLADVDGIGGTFHATVDDGVEIFATLVKVENEVGFFEVAWS